MIRMAVAEEDELEIFQAGSQPGRERQAQAAVWSQWIQRPAQSTSLEQVIGGIRQPDLVFQAWLTPFRHDPDPGLWIIFQQSLSFTCDFSLLFS